MTPSIDTRSARSTGSDRSASRRVATGAGRRAGGASGVGEDERPALVADAMEAAFDWDDFAAPPSTRRSQPAELLYAMFERMGGMPSSHWKGKYINMVI